MGERLSQLNYASLGKRTLLVLVPVLLMPLGIACFYTCGLGANPFSIFVDGEHVITGLSHGVASNYNNAVLFAVMLLFGRKYIGVGTVLSVVTCGTLIDLYNGMLQRMFPPETASLGVRFAILAVGCLIFAVGVGLYISVGFGLGAMEFMTVLIADKTRVSLKWVRIFMDAFWTVLGFCMGGRLGIGTVLGVATTGPISVWVVKHTRERFNAWCGPARRGTDR